mgnify:FL=1
MVTDMQHNVPVVSEVIKTWPFEETPADWNISYQRLLDTVTDGPIEAPKIGPEEYAELFDLCAVQSHFVQAAIAGVCVCVCVDIVVNILYAVITCSYRYVHSLYFYCVLSFS